MEWKLINSRLTEKSKHQKEKSQLYPCGKIDPVPGKLVFNDQKEKDPPTHTMVRGTIMGLEVGGTIPTEITDQIFSQNGTEICSV